jgi:hypothetical protein
VHQERVRRVRAPDRAEPPLACPVRAPEQDLVALKQAQAAQAPEQDPVAPPLACPVQVLEPDRAARVRASTESAASAPRSYCR